jgi:hypothetical protein
VSQPNLVNTSTDCLSILILSSSRSRCSAVTVSRVGAERRGSIPGKNFSLRHRVQIGSGVHPASYPVGTGGKAAGVES